MNLFFPKKKNTAFMTIEILVSSFIISLSVMSVMNIAQRSSVFARHTFYTAQAVFLGEEGAEAIRIMRDDAWTNISTKTDGVPYYFQFTGGTWVLTTDSAYQYVGDVKRKVIFHAAKRDSNKDIITSSNCSSACDSGTRRVNVNVNWTEGGVYYDKLMEFYVMDIWP